MNRVWKALAVLGALVAIGTIGYHVLEDMTVLDALYMTVTTLSTVGSGKYILCLLAGVSLLLASFCLGSVPWHGLRRVWSRPSWKIRFVMPGGGVAWNVLLIGSLTTILSVVTGAWENRLAVS